MIFILATTWFLGQSQSILQLWYSKEAINHHLLCCTLTATRKAQDIDQTLLFMVAIDQAHCHFELHKRIHFVKEIFDPHLWQLRVKI